MGIFTIEMVLFQELQQSLQVDTSLEDGQARFDAIHPHQSFIVQAPAGSGKTALLTQRFLSLLTQVEFPEQIVAMTFTKKAQAEMQERIYHALSAALNPLKPDAGIYETNTWLLAKSALENSNKQGWQLLDNPQRLRIRTLDSMNSSLVQQMPLLSRFGASASVIENPEPLYHEAVREALNNPDIADSSATLLEKVNGNLSRAENLLISMLKKRDQWMPLLSRLSGAADKEVFDKGLEQLVNAEFATCHQQLKPVFPFLEKARSILLSIAPENRPEGSDWSLLQALKIDQNLPGWGGYAGWKQLANALLTQKDEIRSGKGLNKNNGFPSSKIAEEKQLKDDMSEVLTELSARNGDGNIAAALGLIRSLPGARYTDEQWLGVVNLMSLLKTCAAYLKLAFARAGQTDFIEIAQAASDALGEEDQPTDLAQRLDYQIKHLLIDEFQDTSVSQFSLLKKLVAGWLPDEDRTLFIVGDPMQSIYRFREAEVGNFLEVWQGSLGAVTLSCKKLTVNFRSDAAIVEWVNETFPQVLPQQNEIERGAVTYSASMAKKAPDADSQVQTHWAFNRTPAEEVEQIVALIQQRLPQMKPGETIGVLGRSRGHLMPIANALKQQTIAFRAVELEALNERQEIQDAQALTRALLHLSDRPAWLALMRTAAIGLSLADLYTLFGNPKTFRKPVLQQLVEGMPESLSPEGKARLEAALPVLNRAVSQIGHLPWSRLIKETWLALGLAETIESAVALENLEAYWQMLESLAQDRTDVLDFAKLEETMEKLFALPDASVESQQIELMTMHKSKGLEFDTVILPGLGKKPRGDDKPLLSWLNFKNEHADYLVMAPLDQKGQGSSELVSFIQKFEAEKQEYESGRLLYVATTRAKKQLHLFGSVTVTEKNLDAIAEGKKALEVLKPTKKSLLETLWQSEEKAFDALLKEYEFKSDEEDIDQPVPLVSRMSLKAVQLQRQWWNERLESEVPLKLGKILDKASDIDAGLNPYDAMSEEDALMITSIGNLVHGVLEQWVEAGFLQQEDAASKLQQQSGYFRYWLRQQGLTGDALEKALERVQTSLQNAAYNEKLRWALDKNFAESAAELALSSFDMHFSEEDFDGEADDKASDGVLRSQSHNVTQHHIVDRTFVDGAGVRWIVDYKTSYWHEGSGTSKAAFVSSKVEEYRPQLQRYGALFAQLEQRRQKYVLYFTYLDEWVELN